MEVLDIEACLKSMMILIDTREQPTERAEKRYQSFGVPYRRQKLDFGDYTYNFILPNGREYYEVSDSVHPHVMIERKMNLEELSSCLTHDRKRFEAEFERAKQNNSTIWLLVENANWENLSNGKYKTKFNPKAYMASLIAWSIRYDIKIVFCKAETTGRLIKEILYRELKQRLESGEYG